MNLFKLTKTITFAAAAAFLACNAAAVKAQQTSTDADKPKHGGQVFMSNDMKYRIEGAYSNKEGEFRLYLYDDKMRALAADSMSGSITAGGKTVQLAPANDKSYLSAKLPESTVKSDSIRANILFYGVQQPEQFVFEFGGKEKKAQAGKKLPEGIKPGQEFQEVDVRVSGGYDPNLIEVEKGIPVVLNLDRKDAGKCAEVFEMPEYGIKKQLPGFETTQIVFTPEKEGKVTFRCGMDMMRGQIIVLSTADETEDRD